MIRVMVSGYFDPLHAGHIRLFQEAKRLGDRLIVVVNGDGATRQKKGWNFMPVDQRVEILKALKVVDDVVVAVDEDTTVARTLDLVAPDVFATGASPGELPESEWAVADRLGIQIAWRVGGTRISSSSALVRNAAYDMTTPEPRDE